MVHQTERNIFHPSMHMCYYLLCLIIVANGSKTAQQLWMKGFHSYSFNLELFCYSRSLEDYFFHKTAAHQLFARESAFWQRCTEAPPKQSVANSSPGAGGEITGITATKTAWQARKHCWKHLRSVFISPNT